MRTQAPSQLPLFRSNLQAELLMALFLDGETESKRPLAAKEIERRLGASAASVHRELQRLSAAGLVNKELAGRSAFYSARRDSPIADPLQRLLELTVGIPAELRRRLTPVPEVVHASIFGSYASETATPESDIDLLVIVKGPKARSRTVAEVIWDIEVLLEREVDLISYSREQFERKRNGGFLSHVLDQPRIHLVGEVL